MLYGRSKIVEYVRAALRRDGVPPQPFPVMLLLGPHGSGGSAVLRELEAAQPCARLDLSDATEVGSVVFAAVHELRRHQVRGPGTQPVQRFPRLGVVAAALGYAGPQTDAEAFRAHVREPRGNLAAAVRSWTDRAAPLVVGLVQPDLARFLADVVAALVTRLQQRHIDELVFELGDYPLLRRLTNDWRDSLAGPADPAAEYAVDRLLVDAFIKDLGAIFNHKSKMRQPPSNALLLLDNCDNQAAVDFLEHVGNTRSAAYVHRTPADPLVIVAVRHGAFPTDGEVPIASTDPALVFVKPGPRQPKPDTPRLWLPVTLSPLDDQSVRSLIAASPQGRPAQDAKLILALTDGHPAATALFTKLLGALGSPFFGPPGVFDRRLPEDMDLSHIPRSLRSERVADILLHTLLCLDPAPADAVAPAPAPATAPAPDPSLIAQLAVCAAAAPVDPNAAEAVFAYLGWPSGAQAVLDVFSSGLWLSPSEDPDAVGRHLHPLVVRLLRHWLGRDPELWNETHQGYANYYAARNAPRHLLHTLAKVAPANRDPLAVVVTQLDGKIGSLSNDLWHDLLDTVIRAPSRLAVSGNAIAVVNEIAGPKDTTDRRRTIARLVVAKWIFDDPYLDPHRKLESTVRGEDDAVRAFFP